MELPGLVNDLCVMAADAMRVKRAARRTCAGGILQFVTHERRRQSTRYRTDSGAVCAGMGGSAVEGLACMHSLWRKLALCGQG